MSYTFSLAHGTVQPNCKVNSFLRSCLIEAREGNDLQCLRDTAVVVRPLPENHHSFYVGHTHRENGESDTTEIEIPLLLLFPLLSSPVVIQLIVPVRERLFWQEREMC